VNTVGLFHKKISERLAAAVFVKDIMRVAGESWPAVVDAYYRVLGSDIPRLRADHNAPFEFGIACLAVQTAAVPNLFPPEQARRLIDHILGILNPPEYQGDAFQAFQAYFGAWHDALRRTEMPLTAVASMLYDRLHLNVTTESQGKIYKNPVTLLALEDSVVRCGGGWWKHVSQEYRLSES
jgi:hypothetical protein